MSWEQEIEGQEPHDEEVAQSANHKTDGNAGGSPSGRVEIIEHRAVERESPEWIEAQVGHEAQGDEARDDRGIYLATEAKLRNLQPDAHGECEPKRCADIRGSGQVKRKSVPDDRQHVAHILFSLQQQEAWF